MTTSLDLRRLTAALRRSAVRATLAPSVENTQPWHFELAPNQLSITADASRQLRVLDPTGRQMILSCGCALFNARCSLAASGLAVDVERFPDPARSHLVARLVASDPLGGSVDPIAALDTVIELRRTNRRCFAEDHVPSELVERLQSAAAAEECELFEIRGDEQRHALATLTHRADAIQGLNPAYQAERRAWATGDRPRPSEVSDCAAPPANGDWHRRSVPGSHSGGLESPPMQPTPRHQCLLLLGTKQDNPAAWLRAGEALERVLLEVTRQGFAVSPTTQVLEVDSIRAELRVSLRLSMFPHLLLRIGRAATTPATRRRRLVEVLSEAR